MPALALSDERIEDSSDGESNDTDTTPTLKETVKKIRRNSMSRPAAAVDSDEDSDNSGAESQASNSSSRSSTSSAGKRKADDSVTTSAESAAKRAKTSGTAAKRIESTLYVPPSGYVASKIAAHDFSSRTQGMFNGIEGKQVWHISAPSSMNISKLQSMDLEAALRGNPILSRKGTHYLLQHNTLEGQNLLLPKGTVGEYAASSLLPSRSFQIHESAKPDVRNEDDEDDDTVSTLQFFATKVGESKPPRKQPQTLNGRYVPYGVDRDADYLEQNIAIGNTKDATQAQQTEPRTPKKSKKDRTGSTENDDSVVGSKKKSKSKMGEGSPMVTDSHKKKKKDRLMSSSQ